MSRPVHFEIPANEPEKVMDFFSKTFDWKFFQFGKEEYWIAMTGDEKTPGINGSIMKRKHPDQPIANSIGVENIDAAIESITKNGGTIVVPKMPIPTVGYLAYFKDPDGNIHGVFQQDHGVKMG